MISNRSGPWLSLGMAFSRFAQPKLSDKVGQCKGRSRRGDLAYDHPEAGNVRHDGGIMADNQHSKSQVKGHYRWRCTN
jgi:hypothetical protein